MIFATIYPVEHPEAVGPLAFTSGCIARNSEPVRVVLTSGPYRAPGSPLPDERGRYRLMVTAEIPEAYPEYRGRRKFYLDAGWTAPTK